MNNIILGPNEIMNIIIGEYDVQYIYFNNEIIWSKDTQNVIVWE